MNDDDPREIYLESAEDFLAFHSMIERCRDARGMRQYVACGRYPVRVGDSLFFCATGDPLAGTAYRALNGQVSSEAP
jgi:hypothetical protein